MIRLTLVFSLIASVASAEPAISHLQTKCTANGKSFVVHLGDESKDVDNETSSLGYQQAWVVQKKAKSEELFPSQPPNEFLFIKPTVADESVCKDTLAFSRLNEPTAIFFRANNRPSEDFLAVAFYDPMKDVVVAQERHLAIATDLRKTKDGIEFRIHDAPSDSAVYDVTVQGKKSKTTEEVISFYQTLKLVNGKIVKTTDTKKTYEKSPYHDYFPSREAFEKSFAYDPQLQTYVHRWVFRVSDPDCLQTSGDRTINNGDTNWSCRVKILKKAR